MTKKEPTPFSVFGKKGTVPFFPFSGKKGPTLLSEEKLPL